MESKRVIGKICFTFFLISFLFSPTVFAQDETESTAFTPQDQFIIPEYNGAISFATGGSYSTASLVDNIWHFKGLLLTNATSAFPKFQGIRFSVSAQNCNLTITRIDTLNVFPPWPGWVEYTVSGAGNQTLNLNYSQERWLSYTVYVDGEEKTQNDSWSVTEDGWLSVTAAASNVRIHYERASEAFTPADTFAIPECSSYINFAFDGSYVYTNFDSNIWRFQNLIVADYGTSHVPTWYLSISARNCNVTITGYHAPFTSSGFAGWINYTVSGVGNQTFDNNYDKSDSREINKYTVIIDGVARTQNDGWTLADDGWLTVTGATSNVTVTYEYIPEGEPPPPPGLDPEPTEPEPTKPEPTEAPLITTEMVITAALAVAAVIIAVAAVLALKRKKQTTTSFVFL
jgi:hypothetical protein